MLCIYYIISVGIVIPLLNSLKQGGTYISASPALVAGTVYQYTAGIGEALQLTFVVDDVSVSGGALVICYKDHSVFQKIGCT